mgnify:CR=1 FL=1
MNAHSHGLNNHTHTFTPEGTVSNHSHSFSWSGRHRHGIYQKDTPNLQSSSFPFPVINADSHINAYANASEINNYNPGGTRALAYSNYETITVEGTTNSSAPSFIGSKKTTEGNNTNTTSTTSTGSFIGSSGTTGTSGSSTAFSIMPPYVVKYCFERTA